MISLIPLGLEPGTVQTSTQPPIKPPIMQRISVKAISLRDALLVGIVSGYAISAGTLIFNKLAKRAGWQ